MIECKHKQPLVVLNHGYITESCSLFNIMVNDTICRNCESCEGELSHPVVEMDLPRRNNNELQAIQMVCNQCPLFDLKSQMCDKYSGLPVPVSSWSQHPSNHCPESQW